MTVKISYHPKYQSRYQSRYQLRYQLDVKISRYQPKYQSIYQYISQNISQDINQDQVRYKPRYQSRYPMSGRSLEPSIPPITKQEASLGKPATKISVCLISVVGWHLTYKIILTATSTNNENQRCEVRILIKTCGFATRQKCRIICSDCGAGSEVAACRPAVANCSERRLNKEHRQRRL